MDYTNSEDSIINRQEDLQCSCTVVCELGCKVQASAASAWQALMQRHDWFECAIQKRGQTCPCALKSRLQVMGMGSCFAQVWCFCVLKGHVLFQGSSTAGV